MCQVKRVEAVIRRKVLDVCSSGPAAPHRYRCGTRVTSPSYGKSGPVAAAARLRVRACSSSCVREHGESD